MRRIFLTLSAVITCCASFAQTNSIGNTGKVGIGTTSPTALLTLLGGAFNLQTNGGQYTLANVDNQSTTPFAVGTNLLGLVSGDLMLRSYWGVSVDLNDGSQGDSPNAPYSRIPNTTSFTVNSRTSSTTFKTLFTVRNNGNVLIGQTTQTNSAYMLDVLGPVRANSIVVNNTGADFVFEPSYKLISLPTLEEYITRNHHLPEIASAKEMQTNGVDLGQNQVKLLQKVEELTLYMIDKDKQLNDEKTAITTLQHQNDLKDVSNKQLSDQVKSQQEQLQSQQEQIDELKNQLKLIIEQKNN